MHIRIIQQGNKLAFSRALQNLEHRLIYTDRLALLRGKTPGHLNEDQVQSIATVMEDAGYIVDIEL